jgi:diguanylate cyclase (GGDEF)-like protein
MDSVSRAILSGLRDLFPQYRASLVDSLTVASAWSKKYPLYHGASKVGTLTIGGSVPPTKEEEALLSFFVDYIGPLLGHAELHEEVTRESMVDPLTQLPNRRAFEMQTALEARRPFILALLDLDGFKVLNDTKGHPAGDEALRKVAMALRQGLREVDSLYRIGGDEFAITFTGSDLLGLMAVTSILERLRDAVEHLSIGISFSVGSQTYQGGDLGTFIDSVDRLLYADKRRRKARQTGWAS